MLFYIFLIFLNLILIFFLQKKEIKKIIFKKKIPEKKVKYIHPIFETEKNNWLKKLETINYPNEYFDLDSINDISMHNGNI